MESRNAFASHCCALMVYLFLYAPILVLILYSFNDAKYSAAWEGFTLKWYSSLLADRGVLAATKNSLIIAFVSTACATAIGTLTAIGLYKYTFRYKRLLEGILYLPIIIPEIIMAVSMLALFMFAGISLGLKTVIIAHITFSIPFVVVVVKARLYGLDASLEEAAQDLGANEWETFKRITFPLIRPGVIAGALLAFTLSLDDFIITFFTAGVGSTTLPVRIYSMIKLGISPMINAISTILLVSVVGLVLAVQKLEGSKLKINYKGG
ncbi:MAG: ABC transporter permease [Bacillota bacterium]